MIRNRVTLRCEGSSDLELAWARDWLRRCFERYWADLYDVAGETVKRASAGKMRCVLLKLQRKRA